MATPSISIKIGDKEKAKSPLGKLPSYDEGTDYVPQDQLAVVHEGEEIVPKKDNPNSGPLGGPIRLPEENVKQKPEEEPKAPAMPTVEPAKAPTSLGTVTPQQPADMKHEAGDILKYNRRSAGEPEVSAPDMPKVDSSGAQAPGLGTVTPQEPAPMDHDAHALLMAHRGMLNKQFQDAAAKGDLVAAGNAKLAMLSLDKANPWGSEANHPGVLGKIGHIASRLGNVAGDILVPHVMEQIPGTDLNKEAQAIGAKANIKQGEEARVQEADVNEKNALARNAGVGKTTNERTYNDLLRGGPDGGPKIDPDTNTPYDSRTALVASQGTGKGVEEEDVQGLMKTIDPNTGKNYTRLDADHAVLQMRAGVKPANPKVQEVTDYMTSHGLPDNPTNRDLARVEVEKRNTTAKADAGLPAAEQKIRLQADLTAANQDLNTNHADALSRGKAADEFLQKENARHNMRITQIDSAQNALDKSDTNELAASITPVLATMTESNAQGIKRLNPQELAKFMPKSSGDVKQWFEANYDKLTAGQIPENYRADLRELLNGLAQEEDSQYKANRGSIDQTLGQGAVVPKVEPTGKTGGAEPHHKEPTTPPALPAGVPKEASHVYRDAKGVVQGYALNGQYHALTAATK